ncbi:M23 family metallopeptidase [Streptomyces sp. S.PB5]|uniref:peptidoglycan DD-metalloendopeptidase family protein n=1 Tax=Streptomyces sp. S.PB5 TaxID=3020844 RepID=UPI0025B1A09F|nr:M23 family metallopeptidase [Streptomyces sp. S.PB5]MDN3026039.1 M23 family metallopeptidase [Streptomyces sp. S.PB5]
MQHLYEEASRATRRHEEYRRSVEIQTGAVELLRKDLRDQQSNYRKLRTDIGELARMQYRHGGLLPDSLWALLTPSQNDPLRNMSLMRSAHHGLATSLRRTRKSTVELSRTKEEAVAGLRFLRQLRKKQEEARRKIEQNLRRARVLQVATTAGNTRYCADGSVPPHPGDLLAASRSVDSPDHWTRPVNEYVLSSEFGADDSRWENRHTGQDFAVPVGTPVYAVGTGVVIETACDDAFGNSIVVRHANGYYTHYAHLSALQVRVAERVDAGDPIALSGNTGNSSGPHLHFEVRVTPYFGSAIDPARWLHDHGVDI